MKQVFISHPTPYNEKQVIFLSLIKQEIEKYNLSPINLGQNNWNNRSPLEPIKEMMSNCIGIAIIGLERHHCYIGYSKENSKEEEETIHKYSSSPWIHIEAGMAYQLGLPMLILKEKKIYKEGILDPQISNYYIFEFDIDSQLEVLSDQIKSFIKSWAENINYFS